MAALCCRGARATCADKVLFGFAIPSLVVSSILFIVAIMRYLFGVNGIRMCIMSCSARNPDVVEHHGLVSNSLMGVAVAGMVASIIEIIVSNVCCIHSTKTRLHIFAISISCRMIAVGFWLWLVLLAVGPLAPSNWSPSPPPPPPPPYPPSSAPTPPPPPAPEPPWPAWPEEPPSPPDYPEYPAWPPNPPIPPPSPERPPRAPEVDVGAIVGLSLLLTNIVLVLCLDIRAVLRLRRQGDDVATPLSSTGGVLGTQISATAPVATGVPIAQPIA